MKKLQEALSLMNALCNTNVTVADISDDLTKDLKEKEAIIKAIENAKASIELQRVKDLMNRLNKIK